MEIHIGKQHSEKYECCLWKFEAQNFDNLDVHLNTCEVYQCAGCEKIFMTIKDIKKHIEEKQYDDGWHYVYHIKMDRNKTNEVSERRYRSDEIWIVIYVSGKVPW